MNPLNTKEKVEVTKPETPMTNVQTGPTPSSQPTNQTPAPTSKSKKNINLVPIAAILAVIAIGAVVYFTFFADKPASNQTTTPPTGDQGTETPPVEEMDDMEVLEKTLANMNELDTYALSMLMVFNVVSPDMNMDLEMKIDLETDLNKKLAYTKTGGNMFGINIETIAYAQEKNNMVTTYTYDEEAWSVETTSIEDATNNNLDFKEFETLFTNENNKPEIKKEGNKTFYSFVISSNDMGTLTGENDLAGSGSDENIDMPITLTVENNYITEMLLEFVQEDKENNMSTTMTMTAQFDKFNEELNIEIPQEALDAE